MKKPAGQSKIIWANLIHLSFNMWFDRRDLFPGGSYALYQPSLRFDDRLWNDILKHMARVGMNMVVLDLGDGVRYESHPEIAVRNAWATGRLRQEIKKMRQLGLEPVPKLNFSAGHDNWLGLYARRLSTPEYYRVCADLIREVCRLFERPRFFHLGLDEETAVNQAYNEYIVIRAGDLWWHDLRFLCRQVAQHGVRPWIWADAHWFHGDAYIRQVPKNVVQGNWWYSRLDVRQALERPMPELQQARAKAKPVQTYIDLDQAGYDQILTASNWSSPDNFRETVAFARRHLSARRVKGFLQTAWYPTLPEFQQRHMEAIDQVGMEIARWEGRPVRFPRENADTPLAIPNRAGLKVGIYYANPGAAAIVRGLRAAQGINAYQLPRLEWEILRSCEVAVISRPPSPVYFNRARSMLRRWVRRGGRLLLIYDAAGWGRFAPPLFPEIGKPVAKAKDRRIRWLGRPVISRYTKHAFGDHLRFKAGKKSAVLAQDAEQNPVIIAGQCGPGRVVLQGLFTGFDGQRRRPAADGEWQALLQALAWLKCA